jgi:hypothetical protein
VPTVGTEAQRLAGLAFHLVHFCLAPCCCSCYCCCLPSYPSCLSSVTSPQPCHCER